jgi:multidrug efflux pump
VVQQGVTVAKANNDFLMVVALRSVNPNYDQPAINDLLASRVVDQLARLPGVGNVRQFGSEYAMRIWLDPDKLHAFDLAPANVASALRAQNVQFAAGSIGTAPALPGQGFTATVSAEGKFSTPEQFENIILRENNDGSAVKLKDVARVQLGPSNYGFTSAYNGKPAAGVAILLQPGANALGVAESVRERMDQLQSSMPAGVTWFTPFDSTTFVRISILEVVKTLAEALVLVFLVMLVFLQNIRATLIAILVIPVALLGTFLGMLAIGFTINQLTLFGMVLAIGIVVDDAIVVIENVERIMTEEGLSAKDATIKAMGQITGAVVAIAVVLAAVFIPSALQGGSAGIIYRQFALTIAFSMGLSAFLALGFTPALCAAMLKPTGHETHNRWLRAFNLGFEWLRTHYIRSVGQSIGHATRWMLGFAAIAVLAGFLFTRVPSSFLPDEDQGYVFAIIQLPAGASMQRTQRVVEEVYARIGHDKAVQGYFGISGFSFVGSGENVGMGFLKLKDWSDRDETAQQFIQRANRMLHSVRDAQIFVVNLPTIRGLGAFGGFDLYLEDRAGLGREVLGQALGQTLGGAAKNPALTGVRPNALPDAPQLDLTVDRPQAEAMGLSVSDVYSAIQLLLAPVYVNDFFYNGRIKRVLVQADAPYRMTPQSLEHVYLPLPQANGAAGDGVPLSNLVQVKWRMASPSLTRYNGYPALEVVGNAAPGHSSGEAMGAMQSLVAKLPAGIGLDWTGQSLQEQLSGAQAPLLLALSILVVFLALAALYESWSVPVAVMLIVPLGLLGAVLAVLVRGLPDDIFFKIGLITIIGLATKNAILIVEFAVAEQRAGRPLREAVLDAARLRLRPILMTSFAFIFGVLPLALSSGAGANARHALGTGVIGGMLFATVLGLLFIPVFYVAVRRLLGDRLQPPPR